jgi:hypothetical protein
MMISIELEKVMKMSQISKQMMIASVLAFFMLLTRGSHVLTAVSLPDASLAVFLFGGLYLGRSLNSRAAWFTGFFALATVIDFGAAALDPAQGFCLTNGYWGLIPSYAAMWLGGVWLGQQVDAFKALPYALVTMVSSFVAFVVSTQTYYVFSGRFPAQGLMESMQHGWEYLPSWMGFAAMYFAMTWLLVAVVRHVKPHQTSHI